MKSLSHQVRVILYVMMGLLLLLSVAVALAFYRAQKDAQDIQRSIHSYCVDTNQRHDRTIATLERLARRYEKQAKTAAAKAQLRASIKANIELINDLDPKRVCR